MTLTEVSYYSRRFLPFGIICLVVFILFFYMLQFLLFSLTPPKKTVAYINPLFGKVKQPVLSSASPSAGLTFTLDTVEGQPITATSTAKVYFLPASTTRFGFREKIYLMAKNIGFDTEVTKHQLQGTDAIFVDDKQKLDIDITNFNFSYQYTLRPDDPILVNTRIPAESEITDQATTFLKNVGRYPEELAQGKTNVVYLNFNTQNNEFSIVPTSRDANAVEVDLYRPDIDGCGTDNCPIVSPNYYNSQNYVVMIFNDSGNKIIKSQVKFFEKSTEQIGVYPLKTGTEVFDDLKNGKGFVVQSSQNLKNITVKKMFFGYLDPDVYQEYLQPVYIFLGEDNFVAYVPAIANDYSEK